MSWSGIRVTLGCGHMEVRDKPVTAEERQRLVIGQAIACWTCPARRRRTGGQVAAVRQIVNVEPVTSPRRPVSLDPVHWYWEGEGD